MDVKRSQWILRFDVFVTGAVVMILEIVASRLLAPVFGGSVFVWGSLIGIIMASLGVGYFTGGRLADRGSVLQDVFPTDLRLRSFRLIHPHDLPSRP